MINSSCDSEFHIHGVICMIVRHKENNKLKSDVLKINESNEIIVAADKTNNMYKMSYENYDKLLSENITQKYKKEKHQTVASIVNECKSIAKNCISKTD